MKDGFERDKGMHMEEYMAIEMLKKMMPAEKLREIERKLDPEEMRRWKSV